MFILPGRKIVDKIMNLVVETKTGKDQLGELLGAAKTSSRQAKHQRVKYFFKALNEDKVDLKKLSKLADFLNERVEYFLLNGGAFSTLMRNHKGYDIRREEEGTYVFIGKQDYHLLGNLLNRLCEGRSSEKNN